MKEFQRSALKIYNFTLKTKKDNYPYRFYLADLQNKYSKRDNFKLKSVLPYEYGSQGTIVEELEVNLSHKLGRYYSEVGRKEGVKKLSVKIIINKPITSKPFCTLGCSLFKKNYEYVFS